MSAFRSLAESYLVKAQVRLKTLEIYRQAEDFSDVVRESQEVVELVLKGILRAIGIEPPKRHDVAPLLMEYRSRLPDGPWEHLAAESKWLRKEREFAFYGDVDFIPTDEYSAADGARAIQAAELAVRLGTVVISPPPP